MARINVSTYWRIKNTNTTFRAQLDRSIETQKVFDEMKKAIEAIKYEKGFCELWLQDLGDNINSDAFEFLSTLTVEEFVQYVPVMCKAIVKADPSILFNVYANYDDMKCFFVDEMEISYDGKKLHLTETINDDDCGYFCPKCGYKVANAYEEIETKRIECDNCGKSVKVSKLEFVPPTVKESIIEI